MTVFALRMSKFCNAVSKKYAEVSLKMWDNVASHKEKSADETGIVAITNGVHLLTWMDPIWLQPLLDRYVGPNWVNDQDRPGIWERVERIPDVELWRLRRKLKGLLISEVNDRARQRWERKRSRAESIIACGALLDRNIHCGLRQAFHTYKRPDLFCMISKAQAPADESLASRPDCFAGKAHPSDVEAKRLIQKIFQLAQNPNSARESR
jgi:starch phosphorylase